MHKTGQNVPDNQIEIQTEPISSLNTVVPQNKVKNHRSICYLSNTETIKSRIILVPITNKKIITCLQFDCISECCRGSCE